MKTNSKIRVFDGTDYRDVELYDDPSDVAYSGQYAFAIQAAAGTTLYGAMDKGTSSPQILKCVDENGNIHTVHKSASEGPVLRYLYTSTQGASTTLTVDGAVNFRNLLIECKSGSKDGIYQTAGGQDVYFTLTAISKTDNSSQVLGSGWLYGGAGGSNAASTWGGGGGPRTCFCGPGYFAGCSWGDNGCSTGGRSGGHGAKCTFAYDLTTLLPNVDLRNYNYQIQLSFSVDSQRDGHASSCSTSAPSDSQLCEYPTSGMGCQCKQSARANCSCTAGAAGVSYDGINGGTSLVSYETCDIDPVEQLSQDIAFVKVYTQ